MLLYQDVSTVLEAMEASVKFSREAASLPTHQALDLFRTALPALPFHQQLRVVNEFTQYLMERCVSAFQIHLRYMLFCG